MVDHVDARLATAMQDVPVPDGLAQRLLDRLAAERDHTKPQPMVAPELGWQLNCHPNSLNCHPNSEVSPQIATAGRGFVSHVSRSRARRWLLIGGGLLAVAAGLMLAVRLATPMEARFSEQFVLDEAIRCFDSAAQRPARLLSEKAAPAAYPVSQMVLCPGGTRWRPLDDFLGRHGVVYDLPGPASVRAALYVVEQEVDGLATSPAIPPFTTAGYCASAWQEGGLLYVLVVQGDTMAYERYLNLPRSPVA